MLHSALSLLLLSSSQAEGKVHRVQVSTGRCKDWALMEAAAGAGSFDLHPSPVNGTVGFEVRLIPQAKAPRGLGRACPVRPIGLGLAPGCSAFAPLRQARVDLKRIQTRSVAGDDMKGCIPWTRLQSELSLTVCVCVLAAAAVCV